MSGSGFKMGLAIATYEWMAAITLVIVAVFFMPVYLKNKISTMPQYLNKRYNSSFQSKLLLKALGLLLVLSARRQGIVLLLELFFVENYPGCLQSFDFH